MKVVKFEYGTDGQTGTDRIRILHGPRVPCESTKKREVPMAFEFDTISPAIVSFY